MPYSAATPTDLKIRFPAFSGVADADVEMWLAEGAAEAARFPDDIRARAEMAYAAHRMTEIGLGASAVPMGVTSFKSGTFSATVSEAVAGKTGFDATVYGREFQLLKRRAFAGPRLAWSPPASGF